VIGSKELNRLIYSASGSFVIAILLFFRKEGIYVQVEKGVRGTDFG